MKFKKSVHETKVSCTVSYKSQRDFHVKLIIIILITVALAFPANAYTQDGLDDLTKTNLTNESAGCSVGSYWYEVDPVGTQSTGAIFTISGTTNLPVGQEINYMIQVSDIGPGSPELRPPSYTGSTTVIAGNGGINSWSAEIDTTKFETDTGLRSDAVAGDYSLIIGPFCKEVFHFVLINNSTSQNETFESNTSLNYTDDGLPVKTKQSPLPILIIILSTAFTIFFQSKS